MTGAAIFAYFGVPLSVLVLGYLAVIWHEHGARKVTGTGGFFVHDRPGSAMGDYKSYAVGRADSRDGRDKGSNTTPGK